MPRRDGVNVHPCGDTAFRRQTARMDTIIPHDGVPESPWGLSLGGVSVLNAYQHLVPPEDIAHLKWSRRAN